VDQIEPMKAAITAFSPQSRATRVSCPSSGTPQLRPRRASACVGAGASGGGREAMRGGGTF
jgi:hypothetical protein